MPTAVQQEYFSISAAAAYLGMSTDKIRGLINDGTFTAFRAGGKGDRYLRRSQLDKMMKPDRNYSDVKEHAIKIKKFPQFTSRKEVEKADMTLAANRGEGQV